MAIKILLAEDSEEDISAFRSTVIRYEEQNQCSIDFIICNTPDKVAESINTSFDGAIVDLKLGEEGTEGNDVIREIHTRYRIPVIVLTGTPQNVEQEFTNFLKIYKKGEVGYDECLDNLHDIYRTGLTIMLGGRGLIDETISNVFWESILPYLDAWVGYAKSGKETEKALIRFAINHLTELLDDSIEPSLPEEMYIRHQNQWSIKTGSILRNNESEGYYIVLSPACDLVIHNGNMKTDRVMLCGIESKNNSLIQKAIKNSKIEILEGDNEKVRESKEKKKSKAERILAQITRNAYSNYHHYLPKSRIFDGGIVNFRRAHSYKFKELKSEFSDEQLLVSASFTKDIVSRFSSYYARQGQPDFDFTAITYDLIAE